MARDEERDDATPQVHLPVRIPLPLPLSFHIIYLLHQLDGRHVFICSMDLDQMSRRVVQDVLEITDPDYYEFEGEHPDALASNSCEV